MHAWGWEMEQSNQQRMGDLHPERRWACGVEATHYRYAFKEAMASGWGGANCRHGRHSER